MKIDRERELKNCTYIKTILMITVVLGHAASVFGGGWGPFNVSDNLAIFSKLSGWLGSFHIYGFTLISGYIFYYIKYEKGGYQKYLLFLRNKAIRLLVPYVFIAAIWIIPVHVYFYGSNDLFSKFLLGTSPSQLWFLLMLFWVFAIFWLLSDIVNRHLLLGGVIVCVTYCVGLYAPGIYCFNRGLQYLLFFYIGFLIRKCDLCNKLFYKVPALVYIAVYTILYALIYAIPDYDTIVFNVLDLGCNLILHIVGAISAFIVLQKFINHISQENKVMDFFSKHSMVIYLVHQQLIYFSTGWFEKLVPPVALVLINFAFSIIVSMLFSMLMHKTKVTRFLIGGK